jgi:hypothetical protein
MEQSDRQDAPAFVFDKMMEPKRPKVDRVVLDFVKGHVFDLGGLCYSARWRLSP